MKTLTKLLFVIFLGSITLTFAQRYDYSEYPGYVDFGKLAEFNSDDMGTEILVEKNLLKMVGKLVKNEDEELSNLLFELKLIKVNSFEVDNKNYEDLYNKINKTAQKLYDDKWERIVKTKTKDELTFIFIQTEDAEKITGLALMSVDRFGEAAFVNIVGTIDIEAISRLGDKFDIPHLHKVH